MKQLRTIHSAFGPTRCGMAQYIKTEVETDGTHLQCSFQLFVEYNMVFVFFILPKSIRKSFSFPKLRQLALSTYPPLCQR